MPKALAVPQEITEQDIANIRTMDPVDAADIFDARIRALEAQTRRSFVELGLICLEVAERELWARLAHPDTGTIYHSFDAWLASAAGVSRSAAYAAMKTLKTLSEVPVSDLREMPRCNAMTLAQLSSAVQREPETIAAAKTLTEDQFIARVRETHPTQHLERRKKLQVSPSESALHVIEDAIELCMEIEECSREQALEAICVSTCRRTRSRTRLVREGHARQLGVLGGGGAANGATSSRLGIIRVPFTYRHTLGSREQRQVWRIDMERTLAKLAPRDRRIVLLSALGHTQSCIAQEVGVCLRTLVQLYASAYDRLRILEQNPASSRRFPTRAEVEGWLKEPECDCWTAKCGRFTPGREPRLAPSWVGK